MMLLLSGLSLSSISRLKKKVASLFKTLNGQIKLKGISLEDFEGSEFMVGSLKEAFSAIICRTGERCSRCFGVAKKRVSEARARSERTSERVGE